MAVVMAIAMVAVIAGGVVVMVAQMAVGERVHGKMLYYYISPCPLRKQRNFASGRR
jgi:hypothetical protein